MDVMELMGPELGKIIEMANLNIKYTPTLTNILGYGAKCDGVTDDTQAVQRAIDSAFRNNSNTVYIPYNCKYNVSSLTIPQNIKLIDNFRTILDLNPSETENSFFINRQSKYTGGTPGFVKSGVYVYSVVGSGVKNFDFGIVSESDVSAVEGQHVNYYGKIDKRTAGSSVWGIALEVNDHTGADSVGTSFVGIELNMTCNGTNLHANRVGIDILSTTKSGGPTGDLMAGLRIGGNGTGPIGTIQSAVLLTNTGSKGLNFAGTHEVGIDFASELGPPMIAMRMRAHDKILFESSGTYYMKMNTDNGHLEFYAGSTLVGYVDFSATAHAF